MNIVYEKFRPQDSFKENTEQTLVLVDYCNLLYRAWFVSSQRPWIAFCKFFDMLRLCVKRSKQKGVPLKVIIAGESRTKLDRCNVFEGYKGTRKRDEDPKFYKFRADLVDLLKIIGWNIVSVEGAEADDVIASIVANTCHRCYCKVPCENCDCASKYKTDVVIFSGDRDLQQCLAWDRTLIYRAPGLFVTKENFVEEYKIPVEKYGIYKALIGDKSDNIKGVTGFGPARAEIAIGADSVAEDIWENGGHEAVEEFRLALKLVNLDTRLQPHLDELYFGAPKLEELDEKAFNKRFNEKVLLEIKRLKEEF